MNTERKPGYFTAERARLEAEMEAGRLSWRQFHAGQSFVSEAARQVAATNKANAAAGKSLDERRAAVRAILDAYASWRDANERPERGQFLDSRGEWVAR
jgi:hypothetical protein